MDIHGIMRHVGPITFGRRVVFREYWQTNTCLCARKVPIFVPRIVYVMEKFRYIVFAAFLSFLIVFMGVGVPVVQARCHRCADAEAGQSWRTVVAVSDEGCSCGCAMASKAASTQRKKACCACGKHRADRPEQTPRSGGQEPCASVTIQKLNLPVLGTAVHLNPAVLPVIRLIFATYADGCYLQPVADGEAFYADTSPHRQPPRGYLRQLCTLLI